MHAYTHITYTSHAHTHVHTYCAHIPYIIHIHISGKAHTHTHTNIIIAAHTTHMVGQGVHTHTHTPSLTSQVCGNRSGFREAQCQGNLSTHTQGPHNAKPIGLINGQQGATTSIKTKCWRPCLGKTNPGIGNMVSLLP